MTKNMHYLFNKAYFDECFKEKEKEAEKRIVCFTYPENACAAYKGMKKEANSCFTLSTVYPGLFIGLGYPHSCGVANSIAGGFYFDEITGLPVIPGSTLKGMLRSYFEDDDKAKNQEYKKLIIAIAGNLLSGLSDEEKVDVVEEFVKDTFEKEDSKDVFLGAVPQVEAGKRIFTIEYITPHGDNPTKAPIPVKMLKVRPGVKYDFLFILKDFTYESASGKTCIISAKDKENIFKELILLGGIGAKTNVGFSQFTEEDVPMPVDRYDLMKTKQQSPASSFGQPSSTKQSSRAHSKPNTLTRGGVYEGQVTGYNPKGVTAYIQLNNGGRASLYFKKANCSSPDELQSKFPIDTKVSVRYLGKNESGYDDWELA